MKRFIDIGNQTGNCEDGLKEFAFYCTVKDRFDIWEGTQTFETISEFISYAKDDDELDRYLRLIPKDWTK